MNFLESTTTPHQNDLAAAATDKDFQTIKMKTRNKHVAMLHFALKNGFRITDFSKSDKLEEHRIILEKPVD